MPECIIKSRRAKQRAKLAELPESLTVRQAAEVLGCSQSTYYEAIQRGTVPFVRLTPGRVIVPRDMLRRWLRGEYQTPAQVREQTAAGALRMVGGGR